MQEPTKYYPVLIPTLNRYEHFKRCVESLARNKYADKTELVIGLDYPPSNKYEEGYKKIKEYLCQIRGFRKVTIFTTQENLGPRNNLQRLYDYAYQSYDAFIVTEDDNEFSTCFLDFMNNSLIHFKCDERVRSVSGYTAVSYYDASNEKVILTFDTSAWGFAIWRDKRDSYFNHGMKYYHDIALSFSKSFKILKQYPALLSMLLEMLKKQTVWGDTVYSSYNIINDTYQIRPSISMVRNWGQDGTGLHSGIDDSYIQQVIQDAEYFDSNEISLNNVFNEAKMVNKCSFWMGLPKNKIRACYSILGIMYRWFCYQINHPNYK